MLCGERVAVCCENRTEHTDTLCGQSVPHRKHHASTTEPNRLMLCGETVFICCDKHKKHMQRLYGNMQGYLMSNHVVSIGTTVFKVAN
jgi:hypothetical protein